MLAGTSCAEAASRPDDQDCLFLSGVRLHLCCCNSEEQLQLVRIAREGCALRHTDLSPGLTHIVVSVCFLGMRTKLLAGQTCLAWALFTDTCSALEHRVLLAVLIVLALPRPPVWYNLVTACLAAHTL